MDGTISPVSWHKGQGLDNAARAGFRGFHCSFNKRNNAWVSLPICLPPRLLAFNFSVLAVNRFKETLGFCTGQRFNIGMSDLRGTLEKARPSIYKVLTSCEYILFDPVYSLEPYKLHLS